MAAHLVPIAPGGPEKDVIESSTLSGIAIRKIAIKHCVLRYVEIRTSEISNTTLYQCKVYTSMISNSSFDNCIIFNSTINGCTATNSKVHECKFAKLKTNGCTVTTSPLAFRKFSPEIRETIFRDCVDFKDRKTPPLLIALRGDKELYQEAIQLFYKLNFFRLDDRIRERVSTMSANALSTISKLTIDCRENEWRFIKASKGTNILSPFVQHSNINQLHIQGGYYTSVLMLSLGNSLKQFDNVQKMIVDEKPSALHLAGYAKYLSSRFGLEVERPVPYRWVWSAPEGKVLKWNVEKPAETNKSD